MKGDDGKWNLVVAYQNGTAHLPLVNPKGEARPRPARRGYPCPPNL
jgi:hypothetical protein